MILLGVTSSTTIPKKFDNSSENSSNFKRSALVTPIKNSDFKAKVSTVEYHKALNTNINSLMSKRPPKVFKI